MEMLYNVYLSPSLECLISVTTRFGPLWNPHAGKPYNLEHLMLEDIGKSSEVRQGQKLYPDVIFVHLSKWKLNEKQFETLVEEVWRSREYQILLRHGICFQSDTSISIPTPVYKVCNLIVPFFRMPSTHFVANSTIQRITTTHIHQRETHTHTCNLNSSPPGQFGG